MECRTSALIVSAPRRAQWQPPGDLPEPGVFPEVPDLPSEQPPDEPPGVPEPPSEQPPGEPPEAPPL